MFEILKVGFNVHFNELQEPFLQPPHVTIPAVLKLNTFFKSNSGKPRIKTGPVVRSAFSYNPE